MNPGPKGATVSITRGHFNILVGSPTLADQVLASFTRRCPPDKLIGSVGQAIVAGEPKGKEVDLRLHGPSADVCQRIKDGAEQGRVTSPFIKSAALFD